MATTTRNAASPLRRPLVWSHNTTYPGAAGVHSEVSKKSHAIQVTGQRQLTSNLSTIQSIHQKELRSLSQHRKSLETSMLAYTEKMRRISSERLLLAGASRVSDPQSISFASSAVDQNFVPSAWERLMAVSEQNSSPFPETSFRMSVDSGIDVNETDSEEKDRQLSDSVLPNSSERRNVSSGRNSSQSKHRRRRPGTVEKPDVFALGHRNSAGSGDSKADEDYSSSVDCQDHPVAITPFPEFKFSPSKVSSQETAVVATTDEDEARAPSTSSRTSQSSKKKFTKTREIRENYWSFRKAQHRFSITPQSSNSPSKNQQPADASVSPRRVAPKLITKQKPKPPPMKKTFHHTFRYSDAVQNVLRSFDESKNDRVYKSAVRRASEILPTLDIDNLALERKRLREELEKALKEAQESQASSPDSQGTDDTGDSAASSGVCREKSLSAPDILAHHSDATGSEREEFEAGLKSLLRKFDSAYFDSVPARKSVHFRLPSFDNQSALRDG